MAAFPEDADTATEGWKYGFRSVIDRTQYPNGQDKEGASGMSLEAAWKDIAHWPRLAWSGEDSSSEARPDVVVGYIEGGVNYWRTGADQLIKKIYLNRAEVMANPTCAARYHDNGDPWFNVLDFPGTPDHNGNGYLDPEDLIIECSNGVDDDGNGYTDDISGWDFYNRQNNPHSQDVTYGHHNGQMLNGEAAINDGGTLGACPLCMVMPIRAGAEALDRTDDLAQAFLFAAEGTGYTDDISGWAFNNRQNNPHSQDVTYGHHNGQMLNGEAAINDGGTLGACPLCMVMPIRAGAEALDRTDDLAQAFLFAADSGVASIASLTADLGYSTFMRQAEGYLWRHDVVVARRTGDRPAPDRGGVGRRSLRLHVGPERLADAARLGSADGLRPHQRAPLPGGAAPRPHPAGRLVRRPGVVHALRSDVAVEGRDLRAHRGAPLAERLLRLDARVGTRRGADDLHDAREWHADRRVRRQAGRARPRAGAGVVLRRAFALSTGKQLETAENYTVTLRLRVSYTAADTSILTGEERRSIFVHHDPDWPAGFPRRIRNGAACAGGHLAPGAPGDYSFSPGGEGQPALADVAGLGRLQIVFGDTDGYVHAIDPQTGNDIPGFPVTTDPTVVMKNGGWPGVNPGFEPVPINVAVGDLDHDGNLWIVAATSTWKLYVWDAQGTRRPGWPQEPAEGVGPPESPRTPREYSRMPHAGMFPAPILSDWDGDGTLEIIQAGYDGHIHLYKADGSEVMTGNWPIQVRVPDSVPITRPMLNNPSDTRTPIRIQDFRISSSPALAQLDDDPELEIVVRSQMSDTMPSTDVEVLSGVGHLIAYDHDGTYLWTANMDSAAFYYGSAQEFITEGSNSPAVADIDGDGKDEVVSNPVFSLNEN